VASEVGQEKTMATEKDLEQLKQALTEKIKQLTLAQANALHNHMASYKRPTSNKS
jgi:hypothetical protein